MLLNSLIFITATRGRCGGSETSTEKETPSR